MRPRSRSFWAGALLLQALLLLMWSGGSLCLAGSAGEDRDHDHSATHAASPTHEHSHDMHGHAAASPQADEQTQPPHGGHTPAGCAMMVVCSTPAVAAPELSALRLVLGDRVRQTTDAPLALHSVVNSLEPPPPRA